jgi:hypothetical protein
MAIVIQATRGTKKSSKQMYYAFKHIEQTYPKAHFSQIYYLQSTAGSITADYSTNKARAIFFNYIYWTPTNSGAVITFSGQFLNSPTNPFFSTVDNFTLPNWAPLFNVYAGGKININCNVPAINFSLSFQYILHND